MDMESMYATTMGWATLTERRKRMHQKRMTTERTRTEQKEQKTRTPQKTETVDLDTPRWTTTTSQSTRSCAVEAPNAASPGRSRNVENQVVNQEQTQWTRKPMRTRTTID